MTRRPEGVKERKKVGISVAFVSKVRFPNYRLLPIPLCISIFQSIEEAVACNIEVGCLRQKIRKEGGGIELER